MPSKTDTKQTEHIIDDVWKQHIQEEDSCQYKEAKKALLIIFEHFKISIPESWWFTEVFANYDTEKTGRLTKESITDIVNQYYTYHLQKAKIKIERPIDSASNNQRLVFRPDIVYPHKLDRIWQEYNFVECTGKGSFGSVDIVVKKSTGQRRACKTIVATNPQELELVKTEINLIQKLNHPNILRLHETYQSGHTIYIITEFCAGGQLFDRIVKNQNLTEEGIARWIRQIASALAYIHMLGIVHRDIKPENLLLLDDSDHSAIKLIDFGLSSTIDKIEKSKRPVNIRNKKSFGTALRKIKHILAGTTPTVEQKFVMQRAGTLHYMSPEMIRGNYDQQCDIFPLGILLFQLITGTHPFFTPGVDTERTIKQKILTLELKFNEPAWSTVSRRARELCMQMLVKNSKKRIKAADIMEHKWFTTVDQSYVSLAKTDCKSDLTFSVFEGLKEWGQMSTLKQAVLHLLASRLSENEIVDLRYHFEKLDVSQTGMVTTENLKRVAETAGLLAAGDSDDELNNIIQSLDFEGHGYMGYNEFISAILVKKRTIGEHELRRIFEQFDRKKNGFLTVNELTELMESAEAEIPKDLLNLVSDQGQISFFQFLEFMRSNL